MDRIYCNFGLFWWGKLMNAVTEIEDVTFGLARIIEQFLYPGPQLIFGQQQGKGIDVTLHGFVTNLLYRLADIDSPVQAYDISTRTGGVIEQGSTVVGKIDKRHSGWSQRLYDTLYIRKGVSFVIARCQNTGPGVEKLQGLGSGFSLGLEIVDGAEGDLLHQTMK